MGGLLGSESCEGLAQIPTGRWSGEVGWRPIRRMDVVHAGRRRGAAAFALDGEFVAFRRLCSCKGAERAEQFEKESDGNEAPGGCMTFARFSMA